MILARKMQYIRRVYAAVRYASIAGRACLFAGWFHHGCWVRGLLSFAKIMENMELGHNVMHGQYDWMNAHVLTLSLMVKTMSGTS